MTTSESPRSSSASYFGQRLPNGYTAIAFHDVGDGTAVILAGTLTRAGVLIPKGNPTVRYATWRMPKGQPAATESGHYYDSIVDAARDFGERAGLTAPDVTVTFTADEVRAVEDVIDNEIESRQTCHDGPGSEGDDYDALASAGDKVEAARKSIA